MTNNIVLIEDFSERSTVTIIFLYIFVINHFSYFNFIPLALDLSSFIIFYNIWQNIILCKIIIR